jgi:type IV pilus assembly protein PilE
MNAVKKNEGFTLIELLTTVAVIGILASIAYPSYQSHVKKTRRADAQGALMGFANAMERFFTENNTYLGAAGTTATPANTGAPRIYSTQSPVDGSIKYYNLTISAASASTYTIQAAPIAGSPQANDQCGTLTLTNAGVRGITGAASGVQASDCW